MSGGVEGYHLTAAGASVFLEFGTVNMPAFPFYRPAIDRAPEEIEKKKPEAAAIMYGAVR